MFYHTQNLQFEAKPDGPDPAFARRFQEVLGGKWGEMTVANQYLYQGWNCRLPGKYKDMLMAIGTEEMAHVELICTMIARLLDGAPLSAQEAAVDGNPALAAVFGGSNPQHAIVTGGGAYPVDSNGIPWSGAFITASGNLHADFHLNATAEMQGRLQVARLWNMTEDPGVKDTLRFLLARDHYHQQQWLRAIADLEAEGLDKLPVPDAFDVDQEGPVMDAAYQFVDCSDGDQAAAGSWVGTEAMDGSGRQLTAVKGEPGGDRPVLPPGDPRLYGTPPPDMAPPVS